MIAFLCITPAITIGFDAMADIAHEVEVFKSSGGNGIVGEFVELMKRSIGGDELGHQAVNAVLDFQAFYERRGCWAFNDLTTLNAERPSIVTPQRSLTGLRSTVTKFSFPTGSSAGM